VTKKNPTQIKLNQKFREKGAKGGAIRGRGMSKKESWRFVKWNAN